MSKDRRHGVVTLAAVVAALLLSALSAQPVLAAGWTPAGAAFDTTTGDDSGLRMVTDGRGGFIAAWLDARSTPSEIRCQRVDSTGTPQWGIDGVRVCAGFAGITGLAAAADGQDGVVLAWSADMPSNRKNIFVQRVSAVGDTVFAANGVRVDVTTASPAQTAPAVVSDGSGGMVVAWVEASGPSNDIAMQRVLADSSRAWNSGSPVAVAATGSDEHAPRLVADGSGGVFISWETTGPSTLTTSFQHFRANGNSAYAAVVPSASKQQSSAMIRGNGANALMIAWYEPSPSSQIRATIIDTSGNSPTIVPFSFGTALEPVGLVATSGGALLAYSDGARIDVRRLSASANSVGTAVTVASGQSMPANPSIPVVSDGSDGLYAVWVDNNRVLARHVTATAQLDWGGAVTMAEGVTSVQGTPAAVGGTDLLVSWTDDRSGNVDLYSQRTSFTGVTGDYHRIFLSVAATSGVLTPAAGRNYVRTGSSFPVSCAGTTGYHVDHLVVGGTTFTAVPNYTFHNVTGDSTLAAHFSNAPIVTTFTAVANSHRAFSVPFTFAPDAPLSVFANLGPYDITRWRLGHFDGATGNYLEPSGTLAHIVPGAGYWFIGLKDTTFTFSGTATPETQFSLGLTGAGGNGQGWSQFGSPFRFPIAISQLRLSAGPAVAITDTTNVLTDHQVYEWDPVAAKYGAVSVLLPGHAYWLWKQSASALSLRFPFSYDPVAVQAPAPALPNGVTWSVGVSARSAASAAQLTFGAARVAPDRWNGMSSRAIPALAPDGISLVARVSGWGDDDGGYQSVFRPDGETLAWDFDAAANTGLTEASLSFAFTALPADRRVRLSEPAAGWSREVRADEAVSLVLTSTPRRLRLEVVATSVAPPELPRVTALRAVGPNPFRDAATLSFVLAHAGPLRWDVFDLAGRQLRSAALTLPAGEHTIRWDGRDADGRRVAPGLYLVRWRADGASATVRLVRAE